MNNPPVKLEPHNVTRLINRFDKHVYELSIKSKSHDFNASYYNKHRKRFLATLEMLPVLRPCRRALELGATEFFQSYLSEVVGCEETLGTIFSNNPEEKLYKRKYCVNNKITENLTFSIDLESELMPLEDEALDFVMCSEVIEHLDIDPMFMLAEINRTTKMGGYLFLTTPNCCSARNFWKIAKGFRPHFFMQYEKSRSKYRHNIEYDRHAIQQLSESAGFEVVNLETKDVFEETLSEGINLLTQSHLPLNDRGDCIFLLARKIGPVQVRWPEGIYI